ncbi:hypothetical protein CHGG_04164 [Chaetomium globosum CBS 148.51]|uniref:DH domain-containing protein n=1 Tax=Chaetomium globosum (strain ATCC 6205 / CBS 148.51 / DSM 1962 / NBRC 6347 / NRRL 1970) TaxID=306901 RepID=Q2H232_CHAGB|nr:uncharacterized protein CHGG_04164 [Chaetomium globosum CBS 148.51]EAQ87545.1 hypothetical protein CHGG_04164 [Chaetomium globosum CBS 148.51]
MVRVTEELVLSPEHVTLYYASDPLLGQLPVLIFYGPSTTANYTHNSSRIQIHIYSAAGYVSFPRITVSPSSPFYSVVAHLPREFQGDEVCRGLAFGLRRYFAELPEVVKNHLKNQYPVTRARRPGSAPALFGEQHAADLAKAAVQAGNTAEVIEILEYALRTQHMSGIDVDLVLPPGSIVPLENADFEDVPDDDDDDILDPTLRQYGGYAPLVKLFGEPVFLPTSKLRRAPSRPTSLNRTKSFSKNQKVELRMKMGELVDTEERYVLKLNELVNNIANDFRVKAKERPSESISPCEEDLEKLFPKSADSILENNSAFMQELRRIMDETEEEAVKDMDTPFPITRLGGSNKAKDPSGAVAMAKVFLEWFPKFTDCYQDYIRASQNFPQLLNSFLDNQSSFRQRVVQTGEQTIRSLLIEPVQRLPRYSLFIDQIVACLPITHPALQLLLRARDIITNICSMDDPLPEKPHVTNRLRAMVEHWPADLEPQGRLILAVDYLELAAPFDFVSQSQELSDRPGVLLLFSDCIAILQKRTNSGLTGRDFLREIDKPSPAGLLASMTNAAGGPGMWEFAFGGWHNLADVRFTESSDGRLVWMTSTQEMKGAPAGEHFTSKAITSRCFLLQDHYEGRASKWSDDIVKARIEGRFAEKEREDPTWTLRTVRMQDNNFGLHAAVFQEGAQQLIEGRREPAPIRIVLDNDKGTKGAPVGHYGVEVVFEARTGDMRRISMNTLGLNGKKFTDDVALEDFLPTLSRRIVQLLSAQFSVSNLRLVPALVSYYTKILRSINITTKVERNSRSFLSSSPVKMLSNLLVGSNASSSTTSLENVGSSGSRHKRTRSNSHRDVAVVISGSIKDRDLPRLTVEEEEEPPENPLVRLEQTFTGYVANMQARKGYFIGRTLLNRSMADELQVNDLYNRLIEFPYDLDAASELGTEVIFAAFEKFIRIAWREQIGPVMTMHHLEALQVRASKKVVGDFADFVRFLFSDMAPQNRRAFTALMKLLADLLEGCSNDGDRGALTLAFAEMLVDDANPSDYINLLDRLVEDCDRIFEKADAPDPTGLLSGFNNGYNGYNGFPYEVLIASNRSQKSISGSMTSNTSSLRRKFGFDTLLRQNSKTETDRPSMWRTLSKHSKTQSLESATMTIASRSKSVDLGANYTIPNRLRRPGSRDRPPVAGAFDDIGHRPLSSHRLETIGEPEVPELVETKSLKKKRRSSLSDLKSLMSSTSLEDDPALMPLSVNQQQTSEKFNSVPQPESPSKTPSSPQSHTQSFRSSKQKENDVDSFQSPTESPDESEKPATRRPRARTITISQIPTLKAPPSRIPGPPPLESPTRPSSSPGKASGTGQKLRLQSPQKLRERLQTEKKAVDEVDASLRSELSRISEDMARVNSALPRSATADLRKLSTAVKALEDHVPQVLQELEDRHALMQRDFEATLRSSEAKVKAIDQLYKEATAENELLYEKFNSELGKIVKALKGKGREDKEELVARLKESSDEAARAKKENARLRREMVSLRMLLKGATSTANAGSSGGAGSGGEGN